MGVKENQILAKSNITKVEGVIVPYMEGLDSNWQDKKHFKILRDEALCHSQRE